MKPASLAAWTSKRRSSEPGADLITGSVCGVRVEEVEDPLMRKIRMMDKIVDELARGKAVDKIIRNS